MWQMSDIWMPIPFSESRKKSPQMWQMWEIPPKMWQIPKMLQIDQDVANVGNAIMKSPNDIFPTFPTFPTLAPNSQTQKYPQLGEIRWGKWKNMGANVGNSKFPHMPQMQNDFPH